MVCFMGAPDGWTKLGICVSPYGETDIVTGDGAAGYVGCDGAPTRSKLIDAGDRTWSGREGGGLRKEDRGGGRLREATST
jgi:hypothetical protein